MTRRSRHALLPLALLAVAAPLRAGVITVGPSGAHAAIQPAVDAALDGDTILIAPGSYAAFTVNGKHLDIVAAAQTVTVGSQTVIQNVGAGGALTIAGLELGAVQLASCAGPVRFQSSTVRMVTGSASPPALTIDSCPDVAFSRCTMSGYQGLGPLATGGIAVRTMQSTVAFYDCTIQGGRGASGNNVWPGVQGGAGLFAASSTLFASNTTIVGGDGGAGGCRSCAGTPCPTGGGQGAPGLQSSATVRLLECTIAGGVSGTPGCGQPGGGQPATPMTGTPPTVLAGVHRELECEFVAREGQTASLVFRGQPGDVVLLGVADATRYLYSPGWTGVSLVRLSKPPLIEEVGTLPPSGTLTKSWLVPDLGPGAQSRRVFLQAWHVAPGGSSTLGSPGTIVLLDAAF
jgi:hypothetical protein